MKDYPDQPTKNIEDVRQIVDIIKEVLDDDLPDCATNDWFLESVYYANMVDKIASRIWEEC